MRLLVFIILSRTIIAVDVSGGVPDNKQYKKNIVYNDGHLVVLNDATFDVENIGTWNESIDQNRYIPPISSTEVKCMMHVDRYCSKEMAHIKGILIKALKDDCETCTIKEKESVGKIVASMWTHDSDSWKLFLTRFDSIHKLERII